MSDNKQHKTTITDDTNTKSPPEWFQALSKKPYQLLIILIVWISTAYTLEHFEEQPQYEANEYFQVCVMENNKPTLIKLSKIQDKPLCSQNYRNMERCAFCIMDVTLIDKTTNEWHVTSWADSMGDPLLYRYQIDNGNVQPLWWSHGGTIRSISNWTIAFFIAVIGGSVLISVLLNIYRKKYTTET